MLASRVAIALVHHPVYDRNRQVVASAVTNLDIHDIARAARTFGLSRYFIVTPVSDQQQLVARVRDHWLTGWGANYNPKRRQALDLIQIVPELSAAVATMAESFGTEPLVVVTGARNEAGRVTCPELVAYLETTDRPCLLVFGTGWGLTDELFQSADLALTPISGGSDYNHLSVRSAVSIYLDRLFGARDQTPSA
jgi:hypothetical protein